MENEKRKKLLQQHQISFREQKKKQKQIHIDGKKFFDNTILFFK